MRYEIVSPRSARSSNRTTIGAILVIAMFVFYGSTASGLPVFLNPGGTHPPGFVVHLPNTGPAPLPGGAVIGPIPFVDALPSPFNPHIFETELNNPGAAGGVVAYNVTIFDPLGVFYSGSVTLAPGGSAYWDDHYAEPAEVGPYTWTAFSAAGAPFALVDGSVIEYPNVSPPPGGGPIFGGGGGFAGPLIPGIPMITIGVVPEPGTLSLLAIGSLLLLKRRNAR